jgi:hypothetical protein
VVDEALRCPGGFHAQISNPWLTAVVRPTRTIVMSWVPTDQPDCPDDEMVADH